MKSSMFTLALVCVAVILQESSSNSADKAAKITVPARPIIPDTFQVNVQAVFKKKVNAASAVMYYDRPNNRAALELLWQGEKRTQIFNFGTNEMITISGYKCKVEDIPDNADKSFFRFTINSTSKEKIISSPEATLYFEKSSYLEDDILNDQIPVSIYNATMDIPIYKKKDCLVQHYFSKPIFEIPNCESHSCKPTLISLNVYCGNTTDNYYNFFNFKDKIMDETIFQAPPGVFCARRNNASFPILPNYFSFSYDIVTQELNIESFSGIQTRHIKLWYDGDQGLIRRDMYDNSGLLTTATVFDFTNELTYSTIMALKECTIGSLTDDLSLEKITELPGIIFPKTFRNEEKYATYIGERKDHGLVYNVWSLFAEVAEYKKVNDIYFFKDAADVGGIITDYEIQLAFMEISDYSTNSLNGLEKDQIIFIPVNNFRTVPRELSAFDVAACFEDNEKIQFEIKVEGPVQLKETKTYTDLFEKMQTKLLSIGVSIPRISELRASAYGDMTTSFTAWILENPMALGHGKNNSEPNKRDAYKMLENLIKNGDFVFNITDNGKDLEYKATSIRTLPEAPQEKDDGSKKYSGGSMAGVAIAMLIVGLVIGVIGLVLFLKRREGNEKEKLVPS